MQASLIISNNPYHPATDRQISAVGFPVPISALAPISNQPFICLHNGKPLSRQEWNSTIAGDHDTVHFVMLVQGGDGSDPLRIVLSVAIMVAAFYTGGLAAAAYGTMAGAAASAAVSIAGSLLMNAILPAQATSQSTKAADMAAASPTYSIAAQGNAARIGQPVPVQYGRCRFFPDFAAAPWTDFSGNDQYLYTLLMIGQGEYEPEEFGIYDTAIAVDVAGTLTDTGSFEEVSWQWVEPGSAVTLFPASVTTSGEVTGQEIEYGVQLGPYTLNAAGTTVNYVGFDVVCSKGLYYANDSGGLDTRSITVEFFVRRIDDNGDPIGGWVSVAAVVLSGATTTPIRRSYRYAVTAGRYEGYCTRNTSKDTSTRAGNDILWTGFRGYHPGNRTFPGKTVLAVRIKASNNISSMASRKIYVIATRKLKSWSTVGGWAATATATSSIAWALADACVAGYGKALGDSRVYLAQLESLDVIWSGRGDYFNARFDTLNGWWDALQMIARAGRSKAYQLSGIVCFARDQQASLPVIGFTNRNILPNSLIVDYQFVDSETPDGVNMSYFSSQYWAERQVMVPTTATQPGDDSLFGVTVRAHAAREAWYQWACNYYRRKFYTLQTEMEGCIPIFLDTISISHDRIRYGQNGEATAWDADGLVLSVSEPLSFTSGVQHYIALRERDGSMASSVAAYPASTYTEDLINPINQWTLTYVTRTVSGNLSPEDDTGYTITDANTVNTAGIYSSQTAIPYEVGDIFIFDGYIRKDLVSDRVALIRVQGDGGISSFVGCYLRTDTGAYSTDHLSADAPAYISIVEVDGWWRVRFPVKLDDTIPYIQVRFYPAVGPSLGVINVTSVGSAELAGVHLRKVDVATGYQVRLASSPSFTPYTGLDEERTTYAFGAGTGVELYQLCRVLSVRQIGEVTYEVYAVADYDEVHAADGGAVPAYPAAEELTYNYTAPIVTDLRVVESGSLTSPQLSISWKPAPGATEYYLEISYDAGTSWTRIASPVVTEYSGVFLPGLVSIRVAAIGLVRGPWCTPWTGTIGQGVVPPPDVTNLALVGTFTGTTVTITWDTMPQTSGYKVEVWQGGVFRRTTETVLTAYTYDYQQATADGGPWSTFTFRIYAIGANDQESVNYAELEVTNEQVAQLTDVTVAGVTNAVLISFDSPADTDLAGFLIYMDTTEGFIPGAGNLVYKGKDTMIRFGVDPDDTYYLRVAAYHVWGMTDLNYSAEYSATPGKILSTQISDNAILTPHLSANIVTADKCLINELSALSANMGTLTLGSMQSGTYSTDSGTKFDLTNSELHLGGSGGGVTEDGLSYTQASGVNIVGSLTSNNPTTGDYGQLTAGDFTFYFADGLGGYFPYKSVKQIKQGVATNGVLFTIHGYWRSAPQIMPSMKGMPVYKAAYSTVDQRMDFAVDTPTQVTTGVWQTKIYAVLNTSPGTTYLTWANETGAVNTIYSDHVWVYDTQETTVSVSPSSVSSITVSAEMSWFRNIKSGGSASIEVYFYYGTSNPPATKQVIYAATATNVGAFTDTRIVSATLSLAAGAYYLKAGVKIGTYGDDGAFYATYATVTLSSITATCNIAASSQLATGDVYYIAFGDD